MSGGCSDGPARSSTPAPHPSRIPLDDDVIEDPQLRTLFRAESAEHLERIEAGLLALEQAPADAALLAEVFREAHSLKGAARMLGLREVQNLAHGIEGALEDARAGRLAIDPGLAAEQLARLDRIRALVGDALGEGGADAVPGAPGDPGPDAAPTPDQTAEQPSEPQPEPEPEPAAGHTPDRSAAPPAGPPPHGTPDFRIDTLRIPAERLDRLLQLAGELVVTKGRIAHWPGELDGLRAQAAGDGGSAQTAARTLAEVRDGLTRLHTAMAADCARLETVAGRLEEAVRGLRLVPVSTLLDRLPRLIHDLGADLGKPVNLRIEGGTTVADKRIIEELKAPLTHLLRNAVDHGIEAPEERARLGKPAVGLIRLEVGQHSGTLRVTMSDDGRGLDLCAIRDQALRRGLLTEEELAAATEAQVQALVLRPGFSTARMITNLSGRGVGLDAVRAAVERLRGSLALDSRPGQGLTVTLRLPVSLTATRALLVRDAGETFALPFEDIRCIVRLQPDALHQVEGRTCFYRDDQTIPVERLALLLERPAPPPADPKRLHCVVLGDGQESFGVMLDEVLETEDLVVKPTTPPLTRVRNLAGLAVLSSGLVCPVLNRYDLLRTMGRRAGTAAGAPTGELAGGADRAATGTAPDPAAGPRRILLAEDSLTTRMQERRILEVAGYEVVTAVDGMDALNQLARYRFAAVVSDIQMPRMTGLELTERIRTNRAWAELPVVLVTSLASPEDRRRGLEAGADAYLSKSEFDQTELLDCLARLV